MKSPTALRLILACLAAVSLALVGARLSMHSGDGTHMFDYGSLIEPDANSATNREGALYAVSQYEQQQRSFPLASIPASVYPRGRLEAMRVSELQSQPSWKELGPLFAPNGGEQNPNNGNASSVSGRTTSLAVDPSTCSAGACSTMYAGTADGGLWKTRDAGKTWAPLLDGQPSDAVGTVTLDPKNPNIVYVGTGEADLSGDSDHGAGILRSTDGGQTWTDLGYSDFVNRGIGTIIVDPRTAGDTHATLYAVSTRAVSGGATTGGDDRHNNPYLPQIGFWKSTDGGQTWNISNPSGAIEGAQSMVMDPSNPSVLYVGFEPDPGLHTAKPDDTSYYPTKGVYKTTDDGATWTHLTSGLPSLYFDSVTLGIAASNPNILYASYGVQPYVKFTPSPNGPSAHEELYRSADAGATWTRLTNAPNACGDQCRYDMPVTVDPTDPNTVYVGGSANYDYLGGTKPECQVLDPLPTTCHDTVMKSTDGGQTWADVSENGVSGPLHPDDHAILLNPKDHTTIYTANDGGVFHSSDGAASWTDLNKGLGTLQFTGISVAPNGDIYGGTQDNGTLKYTGSTTWQHVAGGDGGNTAVNPSTPNIVYHTYYGPTLIKNDASGDPNKDTFIAAFAGDSTLKGLGQFYEPYVLAPSRPSDVFFGTYRIWRSLIGGGIDTNNDGESFNDPKDKNDWVPISFDLRCPSRPKVPTATCDEGNVAGKGIASIAVAPKNPNIVAVGTSNGLIWLTTNALAKVKTDSTCDPWKNELGLALCDYVSGPKWHQIDAAIPQRYPTSIRFAPGSSKTLFVTLSGFDENTKGHSGHVFMTTDSGRHWKNLNGTGKDTSLPDLPFNDIIVNPTNGHLYTTADYGGVFVSTDTGRTWHRMDTGFPSTPIYQMQYYAAKNQLVVATHGRGVWEVTAP